MGELPAALFSTGTGIFPVAFLDRGLQLGRGMDQDAGTLEFSGTDASDEHGHGPDRPEAHFQRLPYSVLGFCLEERE